MFWASFAVVLVTWGLVPTQAGIFSVRPVTRSTTVSFDVSKDIMPFEQQATKLSLAYSQSAYGIAALNESIPAYMARNYTLAPFAPSENDVSINAQGNYTASTTMYHLDLSCEEASHGTDSNGGKTRNATNGCYFNLGPDGNVTKGDYDGRHIRDYNVLYAGYHNGGYADYYLSSYCPRTENTTFYVAFAKSKVKTSHKPVLVHITYDENRSENKIHLKTSQPSSVSLDIGSNKSLRRWT